MKIVEAKYVEDYLLNVIFDDGKQCLADFKSFIINSKQPMTNQFKDFNKFKKFSIDNGHLTWLNGQMDISCHSIYKGEFKIKKTRVRTLIPNNDILN